MDNYMKEKNNNRTNEGYAIKVAKSIEEVEDIRDIWQQMQWHPNADIDYYLAVVDSRNEIIRPHIITLYKNDCPVTMLIGRIENLRLELKIGYKVLFKPTVRSFTVVYGGILGETTNPNIEILIDELIKSLNRGLAEVVFFSHLNVNSDIYRLAMTKPSFQCRNFFPVPKLHWKMFVPVTMEEFYATRKYKFRKNLRRSVRKLVKEYSDNMTVQCFQKTNEVEQFIQDSEKIAKKTYQRGFGVGFINNIENRRLIALSSEHGWLRSYILYVDGNPVAFERMLQYDDTLFCQNAAYDPDYHDIEPGTNIFLKIIEELSGKHNLDCIDFGFGHAQYKQNFSDRSWKEESVYIFAPTIKCVVINLIRILFFAFSEFAEKILIQTNVYEKIKKYWRIRLTQKSNNNNGNS